MTVFEALVLTEACLCLLLSAAMLRWLVDVEPAPEVELARRAWVAARFSMSQADALGPLFRHLSRASRQGLYRANRLQDRVEHERKRSTLPGPLGALTSPWQRRRTQRSEELSELRHLVEQLEQMGGALARYRAGVGRLMEVQVPLRCVQERAAVRA